MINIFVDNFFDEEGMTVKELIEVLGTYPPHEKVYAEWEGLTVPVLKDNIEQKPDKTHRNKELEKQLIDNRALTDVTYGKTQIFDSEAEMYESITGHKSKHIT